MIRGKTVGRQALVRVPFLRPGQPSIEIEFVVDTGFEGALTLPPAAVAALQLPYFAELDANLANDANVKTAVYVATILWDDAEMEVAVLALGKRPLLGTALLNGRHFGADFIENGDVTIHDLR